MMMIAVFVEDDSTAISALTNNELKISTDIDDFSGAISNTTGLYVDAGGGLEFWLFTVSTVLSLSFCRQMNVCAV